MVDALALPSPLVQRLLCQSDRRAENPTRDRAVHRLRIPAVLRCSGVCPSPPMFPFLFPVCR